MSYVVLARKWRPPSFDDLVGQQHVSRTLSHAIEGDRVAHAFLFTGVRGVGKTTTARILAKALNCAEGPTATPCQTCAACREIPDGNDVDVQEIDGASYNGVDEVRRLQESLPYRPARDRFKVFIVDEVHMLSNAAWNAFLKTLEEPPPHVKFIFATTEVHKVPLTILSRCQRYDFKLIGTEAIAKRLREVLEAEKVDADDEAMNIMAREAAGSMRDAMSLLDQLLAWIAGSDQRLSAEDVSRVLGVASRSVLHRLGAALLAGEPARCLEIVAELAEQGFGMVNVSKDFLGHLRDLVVAKVSEQPAGLLDLADKELEDVLALARQSDADDLSRLYLGFSRAFDDIARSGQPRAALEMALVRLARRPALVPLDDLLGRLARLERALGGAQGSGSSSAGGGAARGGSGGAGRGSARGSSGSRTAPPERRAAAQRRERSRRPSAGAPPAAEPPAAGAPSAPAGPRAGANVEGVRAWRTILEAIAAARPAIASVFEHAAPLQVDARRVVLGFAEDSFVAEQASDPNAQELVRKTIRAHFDEGTELEIDWSGQHEGIATVASITSAERAERLAQARRRVVERPVVQAAMEVFGAELRDVRLPNGSS